jgi:hypothetical protein
MPAGAGFMSTTFHIRSFRRFPVQCPVYYSSEHGFGSGTVWNLSMKGWRADGTLLVTPGMVLRLCVLLPNEAPTVFVDGATVRWSRGQEFGLEISAIQEKEAGHLKRFVESFL